MQHSTAQNILAIVTSSDLRSLAILHGEHMDEVVIQKADRQNNDLVSLIKTLLCKNAISLDDLDTIAVCSGPGSFTGIRVGMSVAKGICLNRGDISISTFSSTELLVGGLNIVNSDICTLMPCRKNSVYTAMFRADSSGLVIRKSDDRVVEPYALFETIKEKTFFVGGGLDFYKKDLVNNINFVFSDDEKLNHPSASVLARLVKERTVKGEAQKRNLSIIPNYVTPSDFKPSAIKFRNGRSFNKSNK